MINDVALPSFEKMLMQLVSTPSVSSPSTAWDQSNSQVIAILADWLALLGFEVERMDVPAHPGKQNLIATMGKGPGGLVLAGHTDTVPFDQSKWSSDPFKLDYRDDRLYGLGSCDMKGFFPVILSAVQGFAGADFKQPLIIIATADEESSMSGARALAEAGRPKARCAVIGEPTGLKPIRMHKGMMMECIRLQGRSGHSSNPALGHSALDCMVDVLADLTRFRGELQAQYQNPAFEIAVPTMNFGHIHGGDNPNRICGACELQFDLRPLPGMDIDSLRAMISQRVTPIAQKHQVALEIEHLFGGVPAFETPAESPFVAACERLSGYSSEAVAFATEAPYLQALGMETVVMGPGSIDQAHQPDEFLAIDQVKPAVNILKGLIQQYCINGLVEYDLVAGDHAEGESKGEF
ncbi:acetylornithine deacetylase [Alkalimarinus coralli]|uniref:acetylornithine deacetylase n=1 Tax=Alkalimarinus coralli TaxID=2935863 RepID=UPI00202B5035|nr:acetylornithine deacetylase [Alkalimarinus coralli]